MDTIDEELLTMEPSRLLKPDEVARWLGCSEWWVKEQARRRRIPFTKVGGAYRFTPEHLHEIVAIFEERPEHLTPMAGTREPRRSAPSQPIRPAVQLRARRPRRTRAAV